jgi:hypothetical protein
LNIGYRMGGWMDFFFNFHFAPGVFGGERTRKYSYDDFIFSCFIIYWLGITSFQRVHC